VKRDSPGPCRGPGCHAFVSGRRLRLQSGEIVRLRVAAVVRCRRRAVPQLDLLDRARRFAGHGTVRVRCRVHLAAGCQLGRKTHCHSWQRLQVPDIAAGAHGLGCMDNRVGIDPMVAVEVGDGSGLPEMLDTQRLDAVTENPA